MSKRIIGVAAAAAASFLLASSANALVINLIDQGGVTGSQAEQGFRIAANYWESVITNNVTLNFGVGYAALDEGVIGSTGSASMDYSVANWSSGIAATKSSSTLDQQIVLPTLTNGAIKMITSGSRQLGGVNANANARVYDTSTGNGAAATNNKVLYLNTANVKAVGGTAVYSGDFAAQQLDADITFSSTFGFDFDPTDGTSAQTFDFIGTAIHEMGHALGFVSGTDWYDYVAYVSQVQPAAVLGYNLNNESQFSALDMFRYSMDPTNLVAGNGPVLDMAVGAPAYFSIDGGQTQLFGSSLFSTGYYKGDGNQASHWKDNFSACTPQLGIMDPTECYAQEDEITALDLAAFDAIGWNLNVDVLANPGYLMTTRSIYEQFAPREPEGAVPEPASWAMMLMGFGLVGGALRRRSVGVRFGLAA